MELRPENPLLLVIVEEAQSSGSAIIPYFGDSGLPTIRKIFESLSNSEAH
jgi:hypothetical protein